jgi:FtsH-binding integral membrane protein
MQGLRVFFTKLFKSKKNKKRSDEGVAVLLTGLIMVLIGLIILIAVFITGSIPGIAVIFGGFGALVCGLALAYESDNNLWAIGGMAAGIVVALLSGYKYFQSRD